MRIARPAELQKKPNPSCASCFLLWLYSSCYCTALVYHSVYNKLHVKVICIDLSVFEHNTRLRVDVHLNMCKVPG